MSKKLIYVTSRFPFPLTKGDKLRAYYQIRDLSRNFDIYLFCTSDEDVPEEALDELKKFCRDIHIFRLKKWKIYIALLLNIFSSKPFQVAYFFQKSIHRKIQLLLEEIRPDHIFSQLIRTSEYVKNYHNCPKTIDYMDALSKGMERRYDSGKQLYKFLFLSESRRLKNYERTIFDYFEHQLIITNQDKNYIFHPDYKKIQVVPNGISASFFETLSIPKTHDLVFVGNLGYAPNIQAAEYLYYKIHRAFPELKIRVSGANPAKQILKLDENNFMVTGFVEDIRTVYSSGKLFVAPMFIGTGLQNKLLEAMAQGIPCITTQLVNNALGAKANEEIIIADSEAEFRSSIQRLLSDDALYLQIRENAKAFIRKNYSWESINRSLAELIENH
ncbi:MAG: glycosyltransferase [Flavobacteriia bacterium]|nr:glycosyltransferase [Flavobacteriia bacterium]OJX37494.1 MAG: hypothetical protein BGO87_00595 [Flavobacteriia bacterium 40-80]